jgi:hypothetical protein
MMLNLAIEDTVGAIPIVGDVAHVAWKANRRNYNLLIREHQRVSAFDLSVQDTTSSLN